MIKINQQGVFKMTPADLNSKDEIIHHEAVKLYEQNVLRELSLKTEWALSDLFDKAFNLGKLEVLKECIVKIKERKGVPLHIEDFENQINTIEKETKKE